MIRKGLDRAAQKVIFSTTIDDAFQQGICIRCHMSVLSKADSYFEWESLCPKCWAQLAEIADNPLPVQVTIQIGDHIGECIAVPPEWDGFTCLNSLARLGTPKEELRRACEAATSENEAIQLPHSANQHHTIFLVPKLCGASPKELSDGLQAMLKLLAKACSPDAEYASLSARV